MRVDVMRSGLLLSIIGLMILCTDGYGAYQLVWSDEFDGTSLNTANWTIDIGNGSNGWGNEELQYYRAENVSVSGGNLILEAREESYSGFDFTSGKVHTRDKQWFLYGRVEARAQIPRGSGMWPAFWMMPQYAVYGGWAASGEIDIMESKDETTYVGAAIHYGGSWPDNTYSSHSYSPGGINFGDAFHVYAIEWEPDEIRWYVDGILYYTRTSSQWYTNAAPSDPRAPFNEDFYIILNAAVGGNYTGCWDPGCITDALPEQYLIDYVRVYQDNSIPPTITITSPSNGAALPAGDIVINATATDGDAPVSTVEFYGDGSLLGEDTSSPYSYTWNSVTDGCYTITAKAIDDVGGSSTDSIDVEVGTGCPQTPYYGTPMAIPGLIEAEDYDLGGEGRAYHDVDTGNTGGAYRSDDVDIEACSDTGGGYNVGWITADEWLEYTVDVATAGNYTIETRVASLTTGGGFHIEFDSVDKTGPVTVPSTGDWQNWQTVSASVNLSAGVQIMRFVRDSVAGDEYNLNYFNISSADGTANADIDVSGTRAGSYTDTRTSDDVYEELTEERTGGAPASRYSYLEHKWTISVASGDTITFNVESYHTANGEGDDFVFAYSTDDSSYTDMLTVSKTSDNDQTQSYLLPSSLSGTVYIRVMDIDQSAGNTVLDTLYIDQMYIDSQSSSTVTVPDVLGMDQVSAQLAITAAGLSVGVIGQSFDNTVAAGDTKSQTPSGGTLVSSGSAVDLEISLGICGDLDVNGIVDIADVSIMASEWLTTGTVADIEPAGGDGTVNLKDFVVLASNWGQSI